MSVLSLIEINLFVPHKWSRKSLVMLETNFLTSTSSLGDIRQLFSLSVSAIVLGSLCKFSRRIKSFGRHVWMLRKSLFHKYLHQIIIRASYLRSSCSQGPQLFRLAIISSHFPSAPHETSDHMITKAREVLVPFTTNMEQPYFLSSVHIVPSLYRIVLSASKGPGSVFHGRDPLSISWGNIMPNPTLVPSLYRSLSICCGPQQACPQHQSEMPLSAGSMHHFTINWETQITYPRIPKGGS
ncbi:hypothetical protein PROFUN_13124 [Planoprotostelium fungivorum]|uniref:Uncharacterized protein n=1 Tax=Planoprotostelium fungivorum TaxID=1890364 RepID=A0A2P6N518_9EUKA|nr:hypothetical protein PROFUN_13124 [Planoprotostelium fungivorum]